MKMKFKIGLFLYALILPLSACASEPQTEVHVTVLDDDGAPVENADVAVGFTPRSGDGPLVRSKTDAEGMVRKKGFSIQPIRYWITKEGFYPSSGEAQNHVRNTISYPGGPIGWAFDESVDLQVTLREIRNPVPMYASRVRMEFPESKGTFAFDLMARDWLSPYGNGRTTDILVHVDFVFRELDDHDLQITWEFVGEVNGIQPFEPIKESKFISPHEAPIDGYENEIAWRNRRYQRDKFSSPMDRIAVERMNDLSASGDGRGQGRSFYLFRIRSEIDENGEIIGGHYGKIYGFGMMLRPDGEFPGGHHTGVVYLNPNKEDRNIEMDLEANLLKNLPRFYEPRRP